MYKQHGEVKRLIDDLLLERRSNVKSSELAKILGKQHSVIMRDIRIELTRKVTENINVKKMFVLSEESNTQNQTYPIYIINSEGLLHLLCRYGRYNYKVRRALMEKNILI